MDSKLYLIIGLASFPLLRMAGVWAYNKISFQGILIRLSGIGFMEQRTNETNARVDKVDNRVALIEAWLSKHTVFPEFKEDKASKTDENS